MAQIISHTDKIKELGNRMVDNLEAQGVSASFEDGGMTLAEKILDIKPFTTTITLTSPITEIIEGQTISDSLEVQATLKAQYSDSLINVDVPIKNVGVFIIQNENEIGYIVDSNGQCGREIASDASGLSAGDHLIYKAVFQGESFYPSCESSTIDIPIIQPGNIQVVNKTVSGYSISFGIVDEDTGDPILSYDFTVTCYDLNEEPIRTFNGRTSETNGTASVTTASPTKTVKIDFPRTDNYYALSFTVNLW